MISTPTSFQKLYIESLGGSPDVIPTLSGNVVALCQSCPGRIDPNDDSAAVVQTSGGAIVLVVADGMGGGPLGHKASAIAVQSVVERVAGCDQGDLRPAILDAIEAANKEILGLEIGAATTLVVVEVVDGIARCYHVGDSQALIIGQRGAIKGKSTPHSPVGYAVESGMLNEIDAIHHEERHFVSNMVGTRSMHIEIGPAQRLAKRDSIVVASDGLFDNLLLDEIVSLGRVGKPIDRVQKLTALASERMEQQDATKPGKPDDLTILLYTQ